jgi:uncharacterized protein (DUF1800 family)
MDPMAAQAAIRFGLGRRPDEPVPADPRAWLLAQLDGPDPDLARPAASVGDALGAMFADRADRRLGLPHDRARAMWQVERPLAAETLLRTDAPFRERLVWFWANHFTVSLRQVDPALLGPYLREAIRPRVTGRFVDMLMAVMTHPAMLIYLNNRDSVGPNSQAGLRRHLGLNENLARECLELHTVGAGAGYTQTDVTNFARILTGWSVEMKPPAQGFVFRPNAHEPGAKIVMGQTFPPGPQGGVAALTWLADHPATHRLLALALTRHFVADTPPPAAVAAIEAVLRDTGGDLGAAARALVALPAAWTTPLAKLRDPFGYVIAVTRALDPPPRLRGEAPHWMDALGQGMFNAPLPNGWPDEAGPWASGEALLRRADWAWSVSGHAGDSDPMAMLEASLGPLASAETTQAVRRAGSRREAIALLLAGPEFQRR